MKTEIWECCLDDLPWLEEMARKYYGERMKNERGTYDFIRAMIGREDVLFLRTNDALLLANSYPLFYDFIPEVTVQFFAGNARQVVMLMKEVAVWARSRGARQFDFSPSTGVDGSKLAKIMGVKTIYPNYIVEV